MAKADLTLATALTSGRLNEFIEQEEAHGVPAADIAEFDAVLDAAIKTPAAPELIVPPPGGATHPAPRPRS